MATSGDEKDSDKQSHKPASKELRKTKVEHRDSFSKINRRVRAVKDDGVSFGEMIRKRGKSRKESGLVGLMKVNENTYNENINHNNFYDKDVAYDIISSLSDRVTSLATFISEAYSLDWKESEKLARAADIIFKRAATEHRAGKALSLEPNFRPAAEMSDTQASNLRLPDAPPNYAYKPRMEGGIVKYLKDNWASYIEAGLLSRPDLRRIDPAADQALQNWLRKNDLPLALRLPTRTEAVDQELASKGILDDAGRREAQRLASAAKRREPK